MTKRLPPYGRQLLIPPVPYLMVFVGEPECWQHASEQRRAGLSNNLCLPDIDRAGDYQWPVKGLLVIVILFGHYSPEQCLHLVNVMGSYHPQEIAVRNWGEQTVVCYQEDAA